MDGKRLLIAGCAAALSLASGRGAFGQAPPGISNLATMTSMSADATRAIERFSTYWTAKLLDATDQAGEVRDVQRELLAPVMRGGVTQIFRDQYTRASLDGLERVVREGNPQTTVNALIVISKLRTDMALDVLVEHASVRNETRRYVRLAAARGAADLLRSPDYSPPMPKPITSAARGLAAAVELETDPPTLRHQMWALLAATRRDDVEGTREQLHEYLVDALQSVAERAAAAPIAEDPVGMLSAVYPIVGAMRNSFLNLDTREQKAYGRRLGPCLRTLLDVANAHWSELKRTPPAGDQPGKMIHLCERFLRVIDTLVRGATPPDTELKQAWDANDRDRYQRELNEWSDILRSY